ncbi:MAG: hypothetical protein ACYSTT_04200 [Planctomycetota bacterium]|jgi:hypothetical protein
MILVDYPGHIIAGMLLAVIAVLVFFAYRCSELHKATRRSYRWPLIVLHYFAILILLLILWNPSKSNESEELSRNSVLVFFDTSESMSVVEEGRVNRLDKALDIFQKKFRPLDADSPSYKIFGFDQKSYHSGSWNFLRRWGSKTDMHNLLSVLGKYDISDEPAKENKVVGAVIFSDGQADDKNVHAYPSLNNKDFQITVIGIGSRNRHTDIAIKSINAPSRIAVDTTGTMQVVVSARNHQNQNVTIELLKDNNIVDSKEIPAELFAKNRWVGDSLTKNVTTEFTIGAEGIGSYSFSIRAKGLEHEVNLANNIRTVMVDVIEEPRLKVLLYSQVANFDIGKLRQALVRDEKIELDLALDVIRVPALAENLSQTYGHVRLPEDKSGFNKYDVIILGPCELDALTQAQISGLYSFVADRGGGLILLPGKAEFGPTEWTSKKMKAMIPVIFDPGNPTIWPANPGQIELTLEALEGKVLDNGALLDNDLPVLPYYRVTNPKPASTTLASIQDTPVISVHRVGRGRVCLLNISRLFSLYRQDLQGGLLYKIMAGLNAHLGRVKAREAGIELFAERAAGQKDKIKFEAYVCDNSFAPVAGANVLLTIRDKVLSMNQTERGHYVVEVEDVYGQAIVATAQAELNGVFLGEKTVAVNLPPTEGEMTNIELDEKFLRELAGRLGGKYFYADQVGDEVGRIFEAQARVGTSRSITSIWPSWPLLVVLCVILGLSWFIRRAIGLV